MKHHTIIPTLTLAALMIIAFVVLLRLGEFTIAVTLICGMTAGLLAGIMYPPKPKGVYRMSDDERRRVLNELDDTAGYLIKESTLRYEIERVVNKDRDTSNEWSLQELRRATEALRKKPANRRTT